MESTIGIRIKRRNNMTYTRLYMQKYLTWELTSISINAILIWSFTGSFTIATTIVVVALIPRMIAYNIHERLYKNAHKKLYGEKE